MIGNVIEVASIFLFFIMISISRTIDVIRSNF